MRKRIGLEKKNRAGCRTLILVLTLNQVLLVTLPGL